MTGNLESVVAAGRGAGRGHDDASSGEEIPHFHGYVAPGEESPERVAGQGVDCGSRAAGNQGIRIVEQEHEERELLERPRGEAALRRQQPNIVRNFATAKEINQR